MIISRRRMLEDDDDVQMEKAHSTRHGASSSICMDELEDLSENDDDVKAKVQKIDDGVYDRYTTIILDEAYDNREYCKIVCTQPRRIAAFLRKYTEKLYTQAIQEILDLYGKTYTWDVKVSVMGLQTQQVAERIVAAFKLPMSWEDYAHRQRELTEVLMAKAELMPGAERLLRHLHTHNIPIALATSSGEPMVEIKITNHRDVFNLFLHRVCGSTDPEVKEGKPSPDIFLVAASRFPDKPEPSKCLVFEDAPNGVRAALSAGMQVVMVPDQVVPEKLRQGATQVLKSLEDFRPEKFGLPPFLSTC